MITNHYWELNGGQRKYDRYWIDHQEYYGGAAAQAIEVYGDGSQHASIYQVGLHFTKGRTYQFYVYLKCRGSVSADGRTLYLAVINRSEDQDLGAAIRVSGYKVVSGDPVRVFELNGKNKVAANPFGSSENVNIREKAVRVERLPFTYQFPAHSVTILELSGTQ
jgi:alpha-L-arabinofuranosidase